MEDKRPLDLALDVLVYVPVGLAVSAREWLPRLAARGRERLTGQVTTARVVGQFAVQQGQAQAAKAFDRARNEAQDRLGDLAGGATAAVDAADPAAVAAAVLEASGPEPAPSRPPTSSPAGAALAIPGYDSLSASQVLPRLDGLVPAELEAVRAYEAGHRRRKTILGRIDQLQSPA